MPSHTKGMTQGNPTKLILKFSLPLLRLFIQDDPAIVEQVLVSGYRFLCFRKAGNNSCGDCLLLFCVAAVTVITPANAAHRIRNILLQRRCRTSCTIWGV